MTPPNYKHTLGNVLENAKVDESRFQEPSSSARCGSTESIATLVLGTSPKQPHYILSDNEDNNEDDNEDNKEKEDREVEEGLRKHDDYKDSSRGDNTTDVDSCNNAGDNDGNTSTTSLGRNSSIEQGKD